MVTDIAAADRVARLQARDEDWKRFLAHDRLQGVLETSQSSFAGEDELALDAMLSGFGFPVVDARGVVAPPNEYSTSPPDDAEDAVDPVLR